MSRRGLKCRVILCVNQWILNNLTNRSERRGDDMCDGNCDKCSVWGMCSVRPNPKSPNVQEETK